jgi:hypothetical protein
VGELVEQGEDLCRQVVILVDENKGRKIIWLREALKLIRIKWAMGVIAHNTAPEYQQTDRLGLPDKQSKVIINIPRLMT